jgi:hypothetical protein
MRALRRALEDAGAVDRIPESTEVYAYTAHRLLRRRHRPIVNVNDEVRELRADMEEWSGTQIGR